jgi:hypothetical protein
MLNMGKSVIRVRPSSKLCPNSRRAWYSGYIDDCEDVNESVILLNHIITSAFNNCFPLIKVKLSTRDPPYIDPLVKPRGISLQKSRTLRQKIRNKSGKNPWNPQNPLNPPKSKKSFKNHRNPQKSLKILKNP